MVRVEDLTPGASLAAVLTDKRLSIVHGWYGTEAVVPDHRGGRPCR
jgi:hypothetical protein